MHLLKASHASQYFKLRIHVSLIANNLHRTKNASRSVPGGGVKFHTSVIFLTTLWMNLDGLSAEDWKRLWSNFGLVWSFFILQVCPCAGNIERERKRLLSILLVKVYICQFSPRFVRENVLLLASSDLYNEEH